MTFAFFIIRTSSIHSLCSESPARMIYQSPSSFGFDLIALQSNLQRKALAGNASAFPAKHIATERYQPFVPAQNEAL
jgi:hypothetical protein